MLRAVAVQTGQVSEEQSEHRMGTRDEEMFFARIKFVKIHAISILCARGGHAHADAVFWLEDTRRKMR